MVMPYVRLFAQKLVGAITLGTNRQFCRARCKALLSWASTFADITPGCFLLGI